MLRTRACGPGAGDKTRLQTGRARLGRSADSVRGSGVRETGRKEACIPVRCLSLFGVTGLYIQKVKDELMSRPFSKAHFQSDDHFVPPQKTP